MQIELITSFLKKIEPITGLPMWAIFALFFVCLFILYFYAIRIPLAVLREEKELKEQTKLLSALTEQQGNYHNQGYKYLWKN